MTSSDLYWASPTRAMRWGQSHEVVNKHHRRGILCGFFELRFDLKARHTGRAHCMTDRNNSLKTTLLRMLVKVPGQNAAVDLLERAVSRFRQVEEQVHETGKAYACVRPEHTSCT